MTTPLLRSWLYAPGNNAKLLERVFTAGADAVILDLEDAVPPGEKAIAREMVAATVATFAGGPALFVRINHPDSDLARDDTRAVASPALTGLRIPKVERPVDVQRVAAWLDESDSGAVIVCIIESALGVWNAVEIAAAHPRVLALAFGAADFCRDTGAVPGAEGTELLYARSRLVLASRVAGIRPPVDTVHTNVQDEQGLRRAAEQAQALGFFGKAAIHPRQVGIINEAFTPGRAEVEQARRIIAEYEQAEGAARGAFQTAGGELVDLAIVRRAQDLLKLAQELHVCD